MNFQPNAPSLIQTARSSTADAKETNNKLMVQSNNPLSSSFVSPYALYFEQHQMNQQMQLNPQMELISITGKTLGGSSIVRAEFPKKFIPVLSSLNDPNEKNQKTDGKSNSPLRKIPGHIVRNSLTNSPNKKGSSGTKTPLVKRDPTEVALSQLGEHTVCVSGSSPLVKHDPRKAKIAILHPDYKIHYKHDFNTFSRLMNLFIFATFRFKGSNMNFPLIYKLAKQLGISSLLPRFSLDEKKFKDRDFSLSLKEKLLNQMHKKICNLYGFKKQQPQPCRFQLKFFVGQGNNHFLIRSALKSRWWWSASDKAGRQDAHFMWSCWRDRRFMSWLPTHQECVQRERRRVLQAKLKQEMEQNKKKAKKVEEKVEDKVENDDENKNSDNEEVDAFVNRSMEQNSSVKQLQQQQATSNQKQDKYESEQQGQKLEFEFQDTSFGEFQQNQKKKQQQAKKSPTSSPTTQTKKAVTISSTTSTTTTSTTSTKSSIKKGLALSSPSNKKNPKSDLTSFRIEPLAQQDSVLQSGSSQDDSDDDQKQIDQTPYRIPHMRICNKLQDNYHLGHKIALFLNLKQYYSSRGENVFDSVPVTYALNRGGLSDPQFDKFKNHYNQIEKQIKRLQYLRRKQRMEKVQKRNRDENEDIVQDGSSRRNKNSPGKNIPRRQSQSIVGDDQESEEEEQDGVPLFVYDEQKGRRLYIPKNIWIIKPGELSNCGRNIMVAQDFHEIKSCILQSYQNSYAEKPTVIVQKYIERPLLVHKRKFDLRVYSMLSSINGRMKGYFYEDGYVRTSSFLFSNRNLSNKFIHLTNDAIQKHGEEYGRFETGNKLSYNQMQRQFEIHFPYVNFFRDIVPQIKKLITDCFRAVYNRIDPRRKHNGFEIYGFDFMIDQNFKVYLIECNTNPDLTFSAPLVARIVSSLIDNAFRLVIDPIFPPPDINRKSIISQDPVTQNRFTLIFDDAIDGPELEKRQNGQKLVEIDVQDEDAKAQQKVKADDVGKKQEEEEEGIQEIFIAQEAYKEQAGNQIQVSEQVLIGQSNMEQTQEEEEEEEVEEEQYLQ